MKKIFIMFVLSGLGGLVIGVMTEDIGRLLYLMGGLIWGFIIGVINLID